MPDSSLEREPDYYGKGFPRVPSIPLGKCRYNASNYPKIVSFYIASNLVITIVKSFEAELQLSFEAIQIRY
jgi:hypothetical protein